MVVVRDINFFTPYVKQQESSNAQVALTATAAVVLIGIAGTLGYNIFQLNSLNKQIATVTAEISEPDFVEAHKVAKELALEKGLLQGYNSALMTVHDGIIDRSIIDTAIMKQINSTIPAGINLKSLAIQGGNITMNATSSSNKQVADFKYNLDKLPMIKESFIGTISSDFGSPAEYSFSVACVLEEIE